MGWLSSSSKPNSKDVGRITKELHDYDSETVEKVVDSNRKPKKGPVADIVEAPFDIAEDLVDGIIKSLI